MTSLVTVGIPVGPSASACAWLGEALASVHAQTVHAEVLLVDDMHGLPWQPLGSPETSQYGVYDKDQSVHVWRAPWRLGVAHAFNACVSLSRTPLTIMMGADDLLERDCVEQVVNAYMSTPLELRSLTYFSLPLRYMDTGEVQYEPCNAAAVTRELWQLTGGFPVESASGAPDAAFLSMIWNSDYFRIRSVAQHPLYHYRRHDATDTAGRGPWQGVILETRNLLTAQFSKPRWGRYHLS